MTTSWHVASCVYGSCLILRLQLRGPWPMLIERGPAQARRTQGARGGSKWQHRVASTERAPRMHGLGTIMDTDTCRGLWLMRGAFYLHMVDPSSGPYVPRSRHRALPQGHSR